MKLLSGPPASTLAATKVRCRVLDPVGIQYTASPQKTGLEQCSEAGPQLPERDLGSTPPSHPGAKEGTRLPPPRILLQPAPLEGSWEAPAMAAARSTPTASKNYTTCTLPLTSSSQSPAVQGFYCPATPTALNLLPPPWCCHFVVRVLVKTARLGSPRGSPGLFLSRRSGEPLNFASLNAARLQRACDPPRPRCQAGANPSPFTNQTSRFPRVSGCLCLK